MKRINNEIQLQIIDLLSINYKCYTTVFNEMSSCIKDWGHSSSPIGIHLRSKYKIQIVLFDLNATLYLSGIFQKMKQDLLNEYTKNNSK